MAFNPSQNTAPAASTGYVKAKGFINQVLTLPGQAPIKLPSMALTEDKFGKLIDWLAADPTRVAKLAPYITLDYRSATPVAKDFDFTGL